MKSKKNYLILLYSLIILCLCCKFSKGHEFAQSDFDEIDNVMQNTTKNFIEIFFDHEKTNNCNLTYYLKSIYDYSFVMDNYLGDYTGCMNNNKNMTYVFFIYIYKNSSIPNDPLFINGIKEGFPYYFKDLLFYENYIFSMCVPTCLKFYENERINPFNIEEDNNKTFVLKFYDVEKIYTEYKGNDTIINYVIWCIYAIFLTLSLFFALVPSYEVLSSFCEYLSYYFCCTCLIDRFKISKLKTTNFLDNDYSLGLSKISDEKLKNLLKASSDNANQYDEESESASEKSKEIKSSGEKFILDDESVSSETEIGKRYIADNNTIIECMNESGAENLKFQNMNYFNTEYVNTENTPQLNTEYIWSHSSSKKDTANIYNMYTKTSSGNLIFSELISEKRKEKLKIEENDILKKQENNPELGLYLINEKHNPNNGTLNCENIKSNRFQKVYSLLSSIFSLTLNVKRIFKPTNKKNKTSSSYINDNSIAFINGLKGFNLICLTYCSIFWIFIESPNTYTDFLKKEYIFSQSVFILPLLYYLYWSIYLTFAYNGFTFGYKFLCHMNMRTEHPSENNDSPYIYNSSIARFIKSALSFVIPQFFRYPLYFFLLFNVSNIDSVINLGFTSNSGLGSGPLFYIYKEISSYTLSKIEYFLLLYANFKMQDTKLTKTSIYVFFFVFINEMQYFFILLLILMIYYYKNNLGYTILIISYFSAISLRAIYLIFEEPKNIGAYGDIRDFFGFEIYSFHFFYGLPVYILGVLFGILYYEYNIVDNLGTNNYVCDSFVSEHDDFNFSAYLKHLDSHHSNIGRVVIKYLASSRFLFTIVIVLIFILFSFFTVYDNYVLFPGVMDKGFTNYKYNWWEKFYSFVELDVLAILIFMMVFKFAIFNNSQFKKLLESQFWIPFSRLYFVIACLLSPITYYFVLNLEYPINFSYPNVLFLSLSVLFLLYLICFFISLSIEVPLKVGFKKMVNFILNQSKYKNK